jgi:hypothetical protein
MRTTSTRTIIIALLSALLSGKVNWLWERGKFSARSRVAVEGEVPMPVMRGRALLTVEQSGAGAGSILLGSGLNNQGLRLRVLQEQAKGRGGAVTGGFVILDVGNNTFSQSLKSLLDKETNAEKVMDVLRRRHAGCGNIANTNVLVLEQL